MFCTKLSRRALVHSIRSRQSSLVCRRFLQGRSEVPCRYPRSTRVFWAGRFKRSGLRTVVGNTRASATGFPYADRTGPFVFPQLLGRALERFDGHWWLSSRLYYGHVRSFERQRIGPAVSTDTRAFLNMVIVIRDSYGFCQQQNEGSLENHWLACHGTDSPPFCLGVRDATSRTRGGQCHGVHSYHARAKVLLAPLPAAWDPIEILDVAFSATSVCPIDTRAGPERRFRRIIAGRRYRCTVRGPSRTGARLAPAQGRNAPSGRGPSRCARVS